MHYLNRLILLCLVLCNTVLSAQQFYGEHPFAHTFSIVARDPETGEMGVAVQSHWFSVGTIVSWGEAGVGVVATQSFVNPSFGPRGLSLLKAGLSPQQAVDALLANDEGEAYRQLAILDAQGRVATHTGAKCIAGAGHITGENFSVQANMMLNDDVWPAMARAFEETEGPLAERLVAVLKAAQEAGGDIRGKQSAALLVVRAEPTGNIWEDRIIDLQIADNPRPIEELERQLRVHRAYDHMNRGDLALEAGDMEEALAEYSAAEAMFPKNEEMKFWHAVTLANNGQVEPSLPIFREVFAMNEDWRTLLPRLVPSGLLTVDPEVLEKILALK
jgi:uncharacterized Ntn-hydrolase superfamily protein